ncbi:MAG TPA: MlaD family protein [Thermomonospora sp.]|nr:MlaD family protein [Thermomonospora sp.]
MTDETMPLPRRLAVTAATLVVTALVLYTLIAEPFAERGVRLTAEFGRAGQGLGRNAPVKVRGVDVGRVSRVELAPTGRVRVTLELRPGTRVPDTATAAVEPASIFGPKFVNLVPGAHERNGPFLASGAAITRTSDPRDLADLLGDADRTLAAIDPDEVATIMTTLARGLDGQGARLRATIDQTGVLLDVAHDHRADARRFLADGADLAGALAGSGDALVGITADANTLISTTAAGGEGRLGAFADRVSELSGLIGHGFGRRGGQLGEGFRSGERAVAILYRQLGLTGDAVRTGNRLLPLYNDLATQRGPGGKHYLAVHGWLASNPCELIVGLCGRTGGR